jgi:hypothetical protein
VGRTAAGTFSTVLWSGGLSIFPEVTGDEPSPSVATPGRAGEGGEFRRSPGFSPWRNLFGKECDCEANGSTTGRMNGSGMKLGVWVCRLYKNHIIVRISPRVTSPPNTPPKMVASLWDLWVG